MTVTAHWYALSNAMAYGGITEAETTRFVDFLTDTVKVMLVTSSYTPDQDAHNFIDDANTYEVTGTTNYTAGGAALGTKTCGVASHVTKLDAADTSWASSTIPNARYAIVYKDSGTASTSPLICYIDFGANFSSSNGAFTITWDAAGIATITAS
jgi:hypothetical protein